MSRKQLSTSDIDFIAAKLISAPGEPKEFKRVHLKITNKRAIANCSYNQKQNIIKKVIHSYGLSSAVLRVSFVGASVLEIYIESESEQRFVSGMQKHGWEFIDDFDFYDMKSFDGKSQKTQEQKDKCMEALVQRLAYLSASTRLLNLQNCILEGLKEETQDLIIQRRDEILELRAGERTAYVQKANE